MTWDQLVAAASEAINPLWATMPWQVKLLVTIVIVLLVLKIMDWLSD